MLSLLLEPPLSTLYSDSLRSSICYLNGLNSILLIVAHLLLGIIAFAAIFSQYFLSPFLGLKSLICK